MASAQFSKMNAPRCGGSCTGGWKRIRPSGSHRFALGASLVVSDTLRRVGVAPHDALLTPWETHHLYSGGRILKCFPRAIARSAARTLAGPTLQNERAEVRGLRHGWREENSALWFPAVRTQGIGLCTRYTATARRSSPTMLCSLHGERILFIWGPNFAMLPPLHRSLGSTHRGRPNSSK